MQELDVRRQKIEHLIGCNKLVSAAQLVAESLRDFPEDGQLWYLMSVVSTKVGKMKTAINAALKANAHAPQEPLYLLGLAGCYLQIQLFEPALKVLERVENMLTEHCDSSHFDKLAELFYRANNLEKAIQSHRRALTINPNSYSTRNQLAALLRFEGKIPEAEQLYKEVLQLNPGNAQACYNLSQLRSHKDCDNLIDLFKRCSQLTATDPISQIQIHFALGKLYEDLENFSMAMENYSIGAELKGQQREYDVSRDQKFMNSAISFFDALEIQQPSRDESQRKPLFVLGLPRTGTTVVERILASHPQVVSGDELNALPMALLEAGGMSMAAGWEALDNMWISKVQAENFPRIGERYFELASNYVGDAPIFVDKLPYNFLYCGFILHALPNARIVHVRRNPFDAAVSNFKMLFNRGYEYSYTWRDIAKFIHAYMQQMESWEKLFPGQILVLDYEKLVENQEKETRRLLEFSGLEWSEDCLNFHRNKSATRTASASQVREPIHSRAIGFWRNYEPMLTELIEAFSELGIYPDKRY